MSLLLTNKIAVPPKILPLLGFEDSVNEGHNVQLNCIISVGQPPIQITWSFHQNNGAQNSGKNQEGVNIVKLGPKSSVLMIDSVKAHHAGNYVCRASNDAGTDEYSTTLVVNG